MHMAAKYGQNTQRGSGGRSGSVVECWTRDGMAIGSSLTSVILLWP